jgi:hypothetical protein
VKAPNDNDADGRVNRKYSVRFLRLQLAREHRERGASGISQPGGAFRQPGGLQGAAGGPRSQTASASGTSGPLLRTELAVKREHRQFELPPTARVDPVKQTLVQLDLPPDIVLKHDIAIPTALLWAQRETPPPMRKQFVAPPLKRASRAAQSLPVAAMLEPPNLEMNVSDLNIGAAFLNDTPHLVRPPAIATPVSSPGVEQAKQIPQVGVADSSQPSAANLISLPDSPLRASTIIILPPANQIAPSGAENTGSLAGHGPTADGTQRTGGTQGNGVQGQGHSAVGSGAAGADNAGTGENGSGTLGSGNGSAGSGRSSGNLGSGAAGSSSGTGAGGVGVGGLRSGSGTGGGLGSGDGGGSRGMGGAGGPDGTLGTGMAGVTRLTLPKDGHYGVVVVGSGVAAPYPESVGALGGKMVYTVYLRVGLRKNWILQYCLPKAAEQRITARGSATPLDAPWPFLILRPNELTSPGEGYVMIHGMITS